MKYFERGFYNIYMSQRPMYILQGLFFLNNLISGYSKNHVEVLFS